MRTSVVVNIKIFKFVCTNVLFLSNSNHRPMAYESKMLKRAIRNIVGNKTFEIFLFGKGFRILTDHGPIVSLNNMTPI